MKFFTFTWNIKEKLFPSIIRIEGHLSSWDVLHGALCWSMCLKAKESFPWGDSQLYNCTTVQPYNDSVNSTAVRVLLTALTTVLSTVNCWQLTMNSTVDCCLTTVQLQPYDAHNCTLLLTRPHEINLKRTQSSRCNAHFTWGHLFIF